jgi:hypothetical protein
VPVTNEVASQQNHPLAAAPPLLRRMSARAVA